MSEKEIGINQARPKLGDLANDARDHGQITYLTHYGRRIAAIVPTNFIPQEPVMTATPASKDSRLQERLKAAEAELEAARATLQRVHDVVYAGSGNTAIDSFQLGKADAYDKVKAALDPASAATWGVSEEPE